MESQVRESHFNLKLDLLKNGHEFSFFQVIRLLRFFGLDAESTEKQREHERGNVRIRPELSLAFPASDIAHIKELTTKKGPDFLVTATFLGLYGTSSPLPTFYTEDLMDEAGEDISATRDFLDIINHRLFSLLFRCWNKYRRFLQVVEEKNPQALEQLFCLSGLGEKELRENIEPYSLIRYTGLFTQSPRSAAGLETLLKDALGGIPIEVIPCIKRRVSIPPDQRLSVGVTGSSLGEDSFIGSWIDDRMGKFRIRIGPLKEEKFHALSHGSPDHKRLAFLTRFYLTDPLEYDIEMILQSGEARPIQLGVHKWSGLGIDTWVFTGNILKRQCRTIFPPVYN